MASGNLRWSVIGRDLAVDLGTANTLVHVRGRGVLLDEPSVVALDATTGDLIAAGRAAEQMTGRTPAEVSVIRPMIGGVIADFDSAERMLRHFLERVHRGGHLAKPRLVICVPSGLTAVEQRAVTDSGYQAGARRVHVIEEAMAAAIGTGMPVSDSVGSMIVDLGGGTTEVAVICLGGIVTSRSVRTGGDDLTAALIDTIRRDYSLQLGERTAERVKIALGSAFGGYDKQWAELRGRDLSTGLPTTVSVSPAEIRRALAGRIATIVDAVRACLDTCPPELAVDVMDRGITLTGGGSLLRGLDARIAHETGVPVHRAENPLRSVIAGAGRCVEDFDALHAVFVTERRS